MTWEPCIQWAIDTLYNDFDDEYFMVFNAIVVTLFMRDSTKEFIKCGDELPGCDGRTNWAFMLGVQCRKSYNHESIGSLYYGDPFYPVFFFVVMPPGNIGVESKRKEACYLVEMQLRKFASSSPNPVVYGISAMGTRFSIFSLKVGDPGAQMQLIDSGEESSNVTDAQWPFDLRLPAGEVKLRQLVDHVKEITGSWGLPQPPFRHITQKNARYGKWLLYYKDGIRRKDLLFQVLVWGIYSLVLFNLGYFLGR